MNKPIQLYLAAKTCLHVRYSKIIAKNTQYLIFRNMLLGLPDHSVNCSFPRIFLKKII